jgi:hypothetical protein
MVSSKSEDEASRERIAELLVEILDHCGAWTRREGEDQNSWERIAASLENLSKSLENLEKEESQQSNVRFDEVLVELEESAQGVRVQSQLLANENEELSEAMDLCQELENICRSIKFYQVLPLSLSLKSGIRYQREDISKMLRETVQNLSLLYNDVVPGRSNQSELVSSLRAASTSLSLRCIKPNQAPWKDAKDLVKILLGKQDRAEDALPLESPDLTVATKLEGQVLKELETVPTPSFNGTVSYDTLMENDSIVDLALAFANEEMQIQSSRCFLVVGAEGSGKTFCLDRIEKRVPATVNGTNYFRIDFS